MFCVNDEKEVDYMGKQMQFTYDLPGYLNQHPSLK